MESHSDHQLIEKIKEISNHNLFTNFVVVGGGPIGLSFGIAACKLGIKVTIVDPRAGIYTRSGALEDEVFEKISSFVGFDVLPTHSAHLKDIENALYPRAQALGIVFLKKSFVRLNGKSMVLSNEETKEETIIPCDIVVDCTGTKRLVIENTNKLFLQDPKFVIAPIGELVHGSYLIVRGKMTESRYQILEKSEKATFLPEDEEFVRTMRELRKLGWTWDALPINYTNRFEKEKFTLYTQIPDNLPPDKYMQWVHILINLHTGKPDLELLHVSRKHSDKKPRIFSVKSHAHLVTPAFYRGDASFPVILHAGDSSADMSFTIGHGLFCAIDRAAALVNSLRVKDGSISEIDFINYAKEFDSLLKEHKALVYKHHLFHRERFAKAHSDLIQMRDRGAQMFNEVADEKDGIDLDNKKSLSIFEESLKFLLNAYEILLPGEEKEKTKQILLQLAIASKKLGTKLYSLAKLALAAKYFRTSLDLYSTYFPNQYANELAILYSNLIIITHKKGDHAGVIKLADKALTEIVPYVTKDKDKYAAKIIYNKCNAILNQTETKGADEKLLTEVEELIGQLVENSFAKGADCERLQKKLETIKRDVLTEQLAMYSLERELGVQLSIK